MDVKIIPLSGCLQVVLAVLTLGVASLAKFIQEKSWPKRVDDQGLTTRGGKQIAWSEFTKMKLVNTYINSSSSPATQHYELASGKGKVVVAPYRLENGDQVMEYIYTRLPESAKAA